jgi:hypothetical protein
MTGALAPPTGLVLEHLGMSGLRVCFPDGWHVAVDPPAPVVGPVVVTWSEAERVAGARQSSGPLAASPAVLDWLGLPGTSIVDGGIDLDGTAVRAMSYVPIPYATPVEAMRKTRSAMKNPLRAGRRLAHTLRRPDAPPLAVELERAGVRVVLLGQSLHRFLPAFELLRLTRFFADATIVVAGTDYDDELATGSLLCAFDAGVCVVADLIGPVRRALDLPMRPVGLCLQTAPEGTLVLEDRAVLNVALHHPLQGRPEAPS